MRKQQCINSGLVVSENRGSQQNACHDLTEHGGLVEFLDKFAGTFCARQKSSKRKEHNHHIMRRQMIHAFKSHWMLHAVE